jgi:hypothetical protein
MRRFRRSFLALLTVSAVLATLLAPIPTAAQTAGWQPGPGAILDNTYDGYIDAPTANATVSTNGFNVFGWIVDKTAQGWAGIDDVQVWLGAMDGGGSMIARLQVAQSRPDVATALGDPYWAASGFSGFVPSIPAGGQTVSVYAHTGGKGWWFKQVSVNASSSAPSAAAPAPSTGGTAPVSGGAAPILVIEEPEAAEAVKTKSDFQAVGYALDPNAQPGQGSQSTGINRVSVYMDADKDDPKSVSLGDAELAFSSEAARTKYGPQFDASGWRLTFKPTQFHTGFHQLFVYAHSVVSNKEVLELRGFDIRD